MAIMITRLFTGEEILGDVDVVDANTIRIENPTQVGVSPNPKTGSVDVHMAPFMPLSAQKFVNIRAENVLCQYEPVTEIVNKYNGLFGSRIIIPTNSGITSL